MKNLATLSVFAVLLLSTAAGAQPTIDSRSTNIFDLIERIADEIDKEIIVDPRLAPDMSIFTTAREPDYESLLGALRLYGYATVETADQIMIIPEQNMRTVSSRILVENDSSVSDHEIVTRVFKLPEIAGSSSPVPRTVEGAVDPAYPQMALSAAVLVPILRPMMGTAAQLAAPPGTNSLVLVDYYDNIRRITAVVEEIIEGLDD